MTVQRQESWRYAKKFVLRKDLPMADKKPKDKKQNNEPFKNFEDLAKKLVKVPKEEVDEKRAEREKRAG